MVKRTITDNNQRQHDGWNDLRVAISIVTTKLASFQEIAREPSNKADVLPRDLRIEAVLFLRP